MMTAQADQMSGGETAMLVVVMVGLLAMFVALIVGVGPTLLPESVKDFLERRRSTLASNIGDRQFSGGDIVAVCSDARFPFGSTEYLGVCSRHTVFGVEHSIYTSLSGPNEFLRPAKSLNVASLHTLRGHKVSRDETPLNEVEPGRVYVFMQTNDAGEYITIGRVASVMQGTRFVKGEPSSRRVGDAAAVVSVAGLDSSNPAIQAVRESGAVLDTGEYEFYDANDQPIADGDILCVHEVKE